MDVRRVIYGLDELNNTGREAEGEKYLEKWLKEARAERDWKSEVSILSELLGQYRRTMNAEAAKTAIAQTLQIIDEKGMGESATGATILLNAATTMKCFAMSEKALPIFEKVEEVYNKTLESGDYRFSGLYNNMALVYADLGQTDKAEDYFYRALDELEQIESSECDRAVTYCNLADLTGNENYLDKAVDCFRKARKDSYYDFTFSKCERALNGRII